MENALFLTNCSEPELLENANKTINFFINNYEMENLRQNNQSHCFNRTRQVGDFLPAFIYLKNGPLEEVQLTEAYDRIDELTFEELPTCKKI